MLHLDEVKGFLLNTTSAPWFKSWTEVFSDLLLVGLFLLVILCWQNTFYVESSGLNCVLLDIDNSDLALSDGRYLSSRCLLESPARFFLFFSYFQFCQFVLLVFSHVMWLHIPKVKSKLDLFNDIFTRILEIKPKFDHSDRSIVPSIVIDEENEEITTIIHDKLVFLITDDSSIHPYYVFKNITNFLVIIAFIVCNFFIISLIIKNGVDFQCDLKNGNPARKEFPPVSCNISPFYYFVGYMCLYQFILVLVLLLTGINLLFLWGIRNFMQSVHDLLGSGGDKICGLPGFPDFALYITMMDRNVKDGGFHLQMIKFVINMRRRKDIPLAMDGALLPNNLEDSSKSDKFRGELMTMNGIAERLQMQITLKSFSPDHIYECVQEFMNMDKSVNMNIQQNIKQIILKEIRSNPLYYGYTYCHPYISYLLTGSICSESFSVENTLNRYEQFLSDMEQGKKWPNNLVLAAASNITRAKIILVKTFSKNVNYCDEKEVFEPFSHTWNGKVAIFSLVYPSYYNVMQLLHTESTEVLEERRNFINSSEFRKRLINQIHKISVKFILQENPKGHRQTKSLIKMESEEYSKRIYDDEFQKTILPPHRKRPTPTRFKITNIPSQIKPQPEDSF